MAVVASNEPRLTVQAAAGSGKTKTLVARYMRFVLEDGLRPDQILSITFTRKAAAEMKRRIIDELRAQGRDEDAQIAETGPIQTVHGFCERMLRENAIAAGIDPEFEVLDQGALAAMQEDALRQEWARGFEDRPYVEAYLRSRTGQRQFGQSGALQETVQEDIVNVLGKLRGASRSRDELVALYESPETLAPAILKHLTDLNFLPIASKVESLLGAEKPDDKAQAERTGLELACGLMQIALSVWEALEYGMRQLQSFDFTELERRAVELVENHLPTRARLQRQYRVLMVDEAQDLNPMQYRLLRGLQIANEMLVGDPQQSIYAFRQADFRLFIQRTRETPTLRLSRNFRSRPEVLMSVDSVFSRWWENYAAMEGAHDPGGKTEFAAGREFDSAQVADKISELIEQGRKPGDIAVLIRHEKQGVKIERALRQRGIVARISGGGQRFYNRMPIRDLANALEALSNPDADLAFLCMLHSPLVGLSLDAVVMLAARRQSGERIGDMIRSDLVALPEADREKLQRFLAWFSPLQEVADRQSAWEVISAMFAKSPYLEQLARQPDRHQSIANVRKLFSMAVADRQLGAQEFAEKIRRIQNLRHKEGDAPALDDDENSVKIMTIHKAKGLEFPVVLLPDNFRNTSPRKNGKYVLVDQDSGLVFFRFGKREPELFKWYWGRTVEREIAEEERVFYVAFTRAQEHLWVLCNPDGSGKQRWSDRLGEFAKSIQSDPQA